MLRTFGNCLLVKGQGRHVGSQELTGVECRSSVRGSIPCSCFPVSCPWAEGLKCSLRVNGSMVVATISPSLLSPKPPPGGCGEWCLSLFHLSGLPPPALFRKQAVRVTGPSAISEASLFANTNIRLCGSQSLLGTCHLPWNRQSTQRTRLFS